MQFQRILGLLLAHSEATLLCSLLTNVDVFAMREPDVVVFIADKIALHLKNVDSSDFLHVVSDFQALIMAVLLPLLLL